MSKPLLPSAYQQPWLTMYGKRVFVMPLQWRHNGCDSVSNHQSHDCLFNRLFRRRSKKTSKLHVTGLCEGDSPGTGEFPAQMASNAENVSFDDVILHEIDFSYRCHLSAGHSKYMAPGHLRPPCWLDHAHGCHMSHIAWHMYHVTVGKQTIFERGREVCNPLISLLLVGLPSRSNNAPCHWSNSMRPRPYDTYPIYFSSSSRKTVGRVTVCCM